MPSRFASAIEMVFLGARTPDEVFYFLSAVVSVTTAASHPSTAPLIRQFARRDVPSGWSVHRRAEPDSHLPFKFALVQSNLHNLDAYLLDVADPQSPNYGKHWTSAEVAETFRPAQDTVDSVQSWLVHDAGIDTYKITLSPDGGTLHLDLTVSEAERILDTEYYVYRHVEGGSEWVGSHVGYSLPAHVAEHVDFVWPTGHFGDPRPSGRHTGTITNRGGSGPSGPTARSVVDESALSLGPRDCDKNATLECLRALYNFKYEFVSLDKNALGVLEVDPLVYLQSDLDDFFRLYAPEQVGNSPKLISVDGGHLNDSETDPSLLGEPTMDFQLLMGLLGRKQEVLLYQISDNTGLFFVDKLLAAIDGTYCSVAGVDELDLPDCGNKPRPKVISSSYASLQIDLNDPDNLDAIPIFRRQCAEIGKLSLTGMTFVTASGDNGVYSPFKPDIICDAVRNETSDGQLAPFIPSFPSSCPYVTSVGATQVAPGKSVHDHEIATSVFPSGGGFSNTFARPSYQNRAVSSYLKNYPPPYGPDVFNRSGRAYPDVAANGWPIPTVVRGKFNLTGGTSASAPIFASLIVAVNDARLAAGKSPVGWINPALYSHAFSDAFNDVTSGNNVACDLGVSPPHEDGIPSQALVRRTSSDC
ncbi:subtilisin-like protein [Fomes fomentarius]|nr:subtilisin-like protein [Fomes fomentarius]